ncbi:MAG: DUF4876 domain-containing protein, partial [Sphingobacterium sp.]
MKKISCYIYLIALLALVSGCRKDFAPVNTLSYTLTLRYPGTYKELFAQGAAVTLKNTFTGQTTQFTSNGKGEVDLHDILPGIYTVTASREITETESLTIIGREGKAFLNATVASLRIQESGKTQIQLSGGAVGGFVIKEFYYTGSRTPNNASYLY